MNNRHRRIERQTKELEYKRYGRLVQAVKDDFETLFHEIVNFFHEVFKAIEATLQQIISVIKHCKM